MKILSFNSENFTSVLPNIFEMFELCMSGQAFRIFLRSSFAQTMNAFLEIKIQFCHFPEKLRITIMKKLRIHNLHWSLDVSFSRSTARRSATQSFVIEMSAEKFNFFDLFQHFSKIISYCFASNSLSAALFLPRPCWRIILTLSSPAFDWLFMLI